MSHIGKPDSDQLVDEGVRVSINNHTAINASGHRDQLDRQYRILSICGMALTIDNAWISIGAALNIAICKYPFSDRCRIIGIFPNRS